MKPTPTWPATAVIVLMTAVFGLSVAVWCGETEFSPVVAARPEPVQLSAARVSTESPILIRRLNLGLSYGPTQQTSRIAQLPTPQPKSNGSDATPVAMAVHENAASATTRPASQTNFVPKTKIASARKIIPQKNSFDLGFTDQLCDLIFAECRPISHSLVNMINRLSGQVRSIFVSTFAPSDHAKIGKQTAVDASSSDRNIHESNVPDQTATATPIQKPTAKKLKTEETSRAPWSCSQVLVEQLQTLGSSLGAAGLQPEIDRCIQSLNQLSSIETINDARLPAIFEVLNASADKLWLGARSIAATPADANGLATAAKLSRASYEIYRAVSIWSVVQKFAALNPQNQNSGAKNFQIVGMPRWNFGMVDQQWRDYLGLDLLEESSEDKRRAARAVLGRLYSVALTPQQQSRAREIIDRELESQLRVLATEPFEPIDFLDDLISFQKRPNGFSIHQLNQHFQNCLWSDQAPVFALAQILDDHYRNANIRLAVSEAFLNRMMDQPRTQDEPVRDQILGANVSGRSQITNRLGVQMVPDPSGWSLVLTTSGNILSRTQAHRDGFVIHSIGSADVFGSKRVSISYDGVQSEIPQVDAVTDNQVIGLDSPFDNIPFLGWTARRVAQRKQQSSAPLADQQVRSRIRSRVQDKMEQAVTGALQKARNEINRTIVSRFVKLSLEPQPVEMRTTENELVLRYRLAGFDQMAADTPRPTVDDQVAVSLQVHDSAINNALERLDIAGQSFSFARLLEHLENKLGTQFDRTDENVHQVEVDFAPFDPIRVDFDQAHIVLTMNLKRLQIERDKSWRNVSVKSSYEVQFDGFYLTLQQVGGVRAEGNRVRVRDEIAIGAIFDHVLKDQYRFSLLPETYRADFDRLGVQLAYVGLSDGWLSVAYDNKPNADTVERHAGRLLPRLR